MAFDAQQKIALTESFLHFQARNRTVKLLSIVDDLGNTVMDNMVAGEPSTVMETRDFNLTLKKSFFSEVGNSTITDEYSKFSLPTKEEMGLTYDSNGTEKYSTVQIQVRLTKEQMNALCMS